MPKLKLEVDALRVDSFDTHPAAPGRGTVEGLSLVPIEGGNVAVPVTNDVKMCLDSWINTCVTARISECPGETCGMYTCETCAATCITRCGATCPTGDNPICCPPA
ncbi:MAG TPA: hypothetical protein VFQ39_05575 [Longimicrobium sp.]|nr:hypothetical protein [Longimicrobium sp.]